MAHPFPGRPPLIGVPVGSKAYKRVLCPDVARLVYQQRRKQLSLELFRRQREGHRVVRESRFVGDK